MPNATPGTFAIFTTPYLLRLVTGLLIIQLRYCGRQKKLYFGMHACNDVCRHQAVTHTFACICSCANSCVDRTGFATHQYSYVATTHKLTAYQADFCCFAHRV